MVARPQWQRRQRTGRRARRPGRPRGQGRARRAPAPPATLNPGFAPSAGVARLSQPDPARQGVAAAPSSCAGVARAAASPFHLGAQQMSLDHYITLGRSGLRVSPLCLGAMTFGEDLGWGSSVEESNAIIDQYLERGGNFIDTANIYTHGHSEKIIGDLVGKDRARRDRVVLATKFFGGMFPGDPNSGGANRKAIVTSLENSLRRLQTDYIDLYWMHAWDDTTPIEETMRTLDDLVASGKVRYLGFSDTPAWKCAEAQTLARLRGWAPLVALQIEYSLLERTVEGDLVPMAREL